MSAATLEHARVARLCAAADRVHRDDVLQSARAARRASRRLRDRVHRQREAALERRWAYWAAGSITHPPTYVPVSWEAPAVDPSSLAAEAVTECRRTAATVLRLATSPTGA